ncbi:MAG: RDD family protein, partial [Deltaproteobacteria bacterium]|nr:RDD family protein [Deltaproteobacteria bacterium]
MSGLAPPRLDTIAWADSPEQVRFEYRVAGPARRGIAYLIDTLIKWVVLIVLAGLLMLGGMQMDELTGWTFGIFVLVVFALEWGYYVVFETLMGGRSPGKKSMRLRVVKEGGYPINIVDSLLRNLLRAADFLPSFYALGTGVMVFDSRFRRLGDLVAGTMVVVEERAHMGTAVKLQPAVTPQELATMPSTAILRPAERETLDLFVRRLDRLSPARADELAELVLPHFIDRLPPDAKQR